MSNHDARSQTHHLRGLAQNFRPIMVVITADDIAMWQEEGRSDAEIEAAITMLAPHLDLAARLLPAALRKRADAIEGVGR